MTRIIGLGVALLAVTLANAQAQSQTKPDPMIAKVESGLAARIQVSGEPADAWTLADRMAYYKVPGVSIAVIKDGKIAWAKGYGVLETGKSKAVDADTIFQAGSISKPTAGVAALRMVEQGKFKLDGPINDALKSWKLPDSEFTKDQPVTLRHILSHGAGLTVHGFPGYAEGKAVPTAPQVLDGAAPANTAPVRSFQKPGQGWRYSGGGYTIMQLAMTDVSGKDFPTLTNELVLKPAGMTRSSYVNPLPMTNRANAATAHKRDGTVVPGHSHTYPEMAAAGLWTTPSDLSRLALSVVASTRGDKGALLGPEMTKQMLTKQIGTYGLGFELADRGDGQTFSHGGSDEGFEAYFFAYADGRGGAVIMTNGQNGGRLSQEILASLASAYGWKFGAPITRSAPVLALTPERAAGFAGDFVVKAPNQPDLNVTITAEDAKLWIEAAPVIPRQRFYVASDTEAFTPESPLLKYRKDDRGRMTSFDIQPGIVAERRK